MDWALTNAARTLQMRRERCTRMDHALHAEAAALTTQARALRRKRHRCIGRRVRCSCRRSPHRLHPERGSFAAFTLRAEACCPSIVCVHAYIGSTSSFQRMRARFDRKRAFFRCMRSRFARKRDVLPLHAIALHSEAITLRSEGRRPSVACDLASVACDFASIGSVRGSVVCDCGCFW